MHAVHLAIDVENLDRSIAFYQQFFGVQPAKVRPGWAKFEPADPKLVLSLNETSAPIPHGRLNHLGIRVDDPQIVAATAARLREAGLLQRTEEGETCCYAVADKAWVTDPDGNAWEVYTVLADADQMRSSSTACCDDTPASPTGCCA